jgi:hypothetical protein
MPGSTENNLQIIHFPGGPVDSVRRRRSMEEREQELLILFIVLAFYLPVWEESCSSALPISFEIPSDGRPAIGNKPTQTTGTMSPGVPWAICITPPPNLQAHSGWQGLRMLGKSGKQLKEFGWIHEIACPSENELYVSEFLNWRVQKLILEPRH